VAESKKKRKKADLAEEQKKAKNKKHLKKKRKKKRETQKEFFFKDTNSRLFFALLALEKIHLIEEKTKNAPRRLYEDSLRRESAEERER